MSSWSRVSESAVNETRSPNSTLVTRRAETGVTGAAVAGAGRPPVEAAPQCGQNGAPARSCPPQDGQPVLTASPHPGQNRPPANSSCPQEVQNALTGTSSHRQPARDDVLDCQP